jgi:phage shock protein A
MDLDTEQFETRLHAKIHNLECRKEKHRQEIARLDDQVAKFEVTLEALRAVEEEAKALDTEVDSDSASEPAGEEADEEPASISDQVCEPEGNHDLKEGVTVEAQEGDPDNIRESPGDSDLDETVDEEGNSRTLVPKFLKQYL